MNYQQQKALDFYGLGQRQKQVLQDARTLHRQKLVPWLEHFKFSAATLNLVEEAFTAQAFRCGFSEKQMPELMALAYSDKHGAPPVLRFGLRVAQVMGD